MTMTMTRNALALTVILSVGGAACATPPPASKPQIPSRRLDLQLPPEAPDEATMQRLPAAWTFSGAMKRAVSRHPAANASAVNAKRRSHVIFITGDRITFGGEREGAGATTMLDRKWKRTNANYGMNWLKGSLELPMRLGMCLGRGSWRKFMSERC